MRYIDLTHTFVDNMPVFPGDPPSRLTRIASVEKEGYTDHSVTTAMHVGTHMDAPLHMIAGGKHLDAYPPQKFTGPGVFVDARGKKTVDGAQLTERTVSRGSIVLVYTGMDRKFGTEAYNAGYPPLTEAFARALVDAGVSIVGIDFINPDIEESFPIHKILLSGDVLIIENLTGLDRLERVKRFDVFAFPMKIHAEAAPVRVIARTI